MKFTKSMTGGWVDKKEIVSGTKCRIVSEAVEAESNFADKDGNPKMRITAKVRFEGKDEAVNVEINRATKDALIDSFGEDSVKWQGNTLTAQVEKGILGGKRVTYLISYRQDTLWWKQMMGTSI